MGTRPGPVKDRVRAFQQRFTGMIFQHAVQAQELGQLPADEDITLLVFELNGIVLAANANFVMTDDPATLDTARRAVRRRLGVDVDSVPSRSSPAKGAPPRSPRRTR
jgi:hypothetical protein